MKNIEPKQSQFREESLPSFIKAQSQKKDYHPSPQKNRLLQREFYQCFCGRNYQSYSALYLHVKIKHNQNLSFKSLKQKTTEWSGSIKNVYYEFAEKQQSQGKVFQKSNRNLRERSIKMSFKQYSSQEERPKKDFIKKQYIYVDDNIIQVLAKYQILSQKRTSKFKKVVLSQLIRFVDCNYKDLLPKSEDCQSFCQQNTCEDLPLMLNQFIESQYSEKPQKQRVISQLLKLSNWLYDNSYSSRLIVQLKQFERLNGEIEQDNKVNPLKAQNQQR